MWFFFSSSTWALDAQSASSLWTSTSFPSYAACRRAPLGKGNLFLLVLRDGEQVVAAAFGVVDDAEVFLLLLLEEMRVMCRVFLVNDWLGLDDDSSWSLLRLESSRSLFVVVDAIFGKELGVIMFRVFMADDFGSNSTDN